MNERTIRKPVEIVGIGLHKGVPVRLRLEPIEEGGIRFYRIDHGVTIPAVAENVVDTRLATVLGKDGVTISTVEHLLSALSAVGIDHLRILIDNDEVPIMDGSSYPFIMLLREAGIRELSTPKKFYKIKKPVEIREGKKRVQLLPANDIRFQFEINFNHPMIGQQKYNFRFSLEEYIEEIARARTFGFLREVEYLRSIGLALGGSLENAVVLDDTTILNDSLRYPNEFVRHKILDAIGDLRLIGGNIIGEYRGIGSGHNLNHRLVLKGLEEGAIEPITIGQIPERERFLVPTIG